MNWNDIKKNSTKLAWPGRKAASRRVLAIALVLFPCAWIVTALLIGSWNPLKEHNQEAWRHLGQAVFFFAGTVAMVFLVTLLPEMQRFVKWASSWRIIRRCLIVLAWTVTIIALFYGEENWRGHRAWKKYRDTLTAQGAQLDWKAYIPGPIPDSNNFTATPEVQSWFKRYTNGNQTSFSNRWSSDEFSLASGMVLSDASKLPPRLTDFGAWQMAFAAVRAGNKHPADTFKTDNVDPKIRAEAARAVLEDLKPVATRLEELRAASGRPYCVYPVVYDVDNPWGILLPHLSNVKSICLHLDLRACAELAAGQSDRALDDVKLALRLGDSLKGEPFLVSYLVRLATFHIAAHSVWEGLAEHNWSDTQLKDLQQLLERYDFIADLKPPLDEERAAGILTADLLANGKYTLNLLTSDPNPSRGSAANAFGKIVPHGWYDLEKLSYCRLYNLQLEGAYDVSARTVFPLKIAENMAALDRAFAGRNPISTILIRHQLLAVIMLPALGNVPKKAAAAQSVLDQAIMACALERYRLAHGQIPDKLEALVPEFITALPHDVITGGPYQYQRTADSFVLYSLGWNRTDDAGKAVMKGSALDLDAGDWVWEYPTK